MPNPQKYHFDFKPYRFPSDHPIYVVWGNMKIRCNPKIKKTARNLAYKNIRLEEPWKSSFQAFVDDMFPTWKQGLTIERIDVGGNYCKRNCTWVTPEKQHRNRTDSLKILFNGKTQIAKDWAVELDIPAITIYTRILKKWPTEAVLFKGDFLKTRDRLKFCSMYPQHVNWISKMFIGNIHPITAFGETRCITEWCKMYKISHDVLSSRLIRGWEPEIAITKKLRSNCRTKSKLRIREGDTRYFQAD